MIQMFERNLLSANMISSLARSYNPLGSVQQLRNLLSVGITDFEINLVQKVNLHRIINDILIKCYKGEATLKAKLVDKFIKSKVTAAFEIRVNKSRADFLTINGDSVSFEIKSELDNLNKLAKQISDYEKVFDFNYVVIDERHFSKAVEIIPQRYGIMLLRKGKLVNQRKGERNNKHDVVRQLELFSKKEFNQAFPIPGISKEEVVVNFTDEEINDQFKHMLKLRYSKRWTFLVENAENINPIDYQFFFQHNLTPSLIYGG
jgi:hypothetical protein